MMRPTINDKPDCARKKIASAIAYYLGVGVRVRVRVRLGLG